MAADGRRFIVTDHARIRDPAAGKHPLSDRAMINCIKAAFRRPVPKGANAMIRRLYLEREGARPLFTHIVDKLETAATNADKEPAVFFHQKADGTWRAGAAAVPEAAL